MVLGIESYLAEILHVKVEVESLDFPSRLPSFLKTLYAFYDVKIGRICCLVLATKGNVSTPAQIAKHMDLIRALTDVPVVLTTPSLSAYNRSRLIEQGISFIVPGNQLYAPELAVDLREHFRAVNKPKSHYISPAAQAVLFHHILYQDDQASTAILLARKLHYSSMSIGRAFDDLVSHQLAHVTKKGKENHLVFDLARRPLFEKSLDVLVSPLRTIKSIKGREVSDLKWGGESALGHLTDLSLPPKKVLVVAASQWKLLSRQNQWTEVEKDQADMFIETWSYDPAVLSSSLTVDPLSLYLQYRNHSDERLAIAAKSLLEQVLW